MKIENVAHLANIVRETSSGALCESIIKGMNICFESVVRPCFECAISNSVLMEGSINDPNAPIFAAIKNGEWDTTGDLDTDYPIFMASMQKSKHPGSLTMYSLDKYKEKNARLFKVAGFDAGFAIAGDGDIISVHNNSDYANVAPAMIAKAKELGGDHLDHFDFEKLNDVYGGAGFEVYDTYKWDDQYAPTEWNYERDGRPDVKLRGLPSYLEKIKN